MSPRTFEIKRIGKRWNNKDFADGNENVESNIDRKNKIKEQRRAQKHDLTYKGVVRLTATLLLLYHVKYT